MNPKTSQAITIAALALAAVALVFGISAKNGNTSDEELSNQVKEEVATQQSAASGAQSTAGSAQSEAQSNSASIKAVDERLKTIEAQTAKIAQLEQQVTTLSNQEQTDQKNITQLQQQFIKLQAKVDAGN